MGQYRDEILLNKIVARLKKLREQHGVTLEQFLLDTNINISRIESAKSNISVSTMNAICQYFNLTMEQFFKGM